MGIEDSKIGQASKLLGMNKHETVNGIVYNSSNDVLYYEVRTSTLECQTQEKTKQVAGNLKVNLLNPGIQANSNYKADTSFKKIQNVGCVRVLPTRMSLTGLSNIPVGSKFSLFTLNKDNSKQFIINSIEVKDQSDVCIKVRLDKSHKSINSLEVEKIVQQAGCGSLKLQRCPNCLNMFLQVSNEQTYCIQCTIKCKNQLKCPTCSYIQNSKCKSCQIAGNCSLVPPTKM